MRPERYSCLLLFFVFIFSVLAPMPLAAAENAREAVRPGGPVVGIAPGNAADPAVRSDLEDEWRRAGADIASARAAFDSLKNTMSAAVANADADVVPRAGGLSSRLESLRAKLVDKLARVIDEMGPLRFADYVEKNFDVNLVPYEHRDADEQLLRGAVLRGFDRAFSVVAHEMTSGDRRLVKDAIKQADLVISSIEGGADANEVAGLLKAREASPVGAKASDGRGGFFRAVGKVLYTLFVCAAVGAIGIVSLGFLASAATAAVWSHVAVGAAGVIACLAGIIYYVAKCVRDLAHGRAPMNTARPVAATGGAR